jgi:hypothetical protein
VCTAAAKGQVGDDTVVPAIGAFMRCVCDPPLLRAAARPGRSEYLLWQRAHRCRICTGIEPTNCHIGTGTGLTPAASAPGLGPPLPNLRRD